jgi:parallel beta-helix repeat protein
VVINENLITNNVGDSATVAKTIVGIMGVCCREHSFVTITNNDIIRNSWDGIALYRGAVATIENNTVDGVDKARGAQIGGGRGVGIGVTWNGRATIRNNRVTRYWKGIGLFVDAYGIVEGNIVEDIITWGISYWDADKGLPVGFIRNNVIYKTGACGASITRAREGEKTGEFTNNIIVETGQNPKYDPPDYYCFQCALALHAVPNSFIIKDNLFYNNRRATPDLPDHDVPLGEFMNASRTQRESLAHKARFRSSLFLRDFHR